MHISEREPGDVKRLRTMARKENHARQRDRLLVVVKAIEGKETQEIEAALDRSRAFVQRWAYAYRDGGIEAVRSKRRGGSKPKLSQSAHERLRELIDAGPPADSGLSAYQGRDIQQLIEKEFGVKVSVMTAYRTLHRLGYSCLVPRPSHEKRDEKAQEAFRESAPLFSRA